MARLPRWLQPCLTLLTAMPAPGESGARFSPALALGAAFSRLGAGVLLSVAAMQHDSIFVAALLYAGGLILTTSGMSIFQVIVFHYCGHEKFLGPRADTFIGRLVSIIFLLECFDVYKKNHLQHHRLQKIFTENDEFVVFLVKVCRLRAGYSKKRLWYSVAMCMISPVFHMKYFASRVINSIKSNHKIYVVLHISYWSAFIFSVVALGIGRETILAWIVPLATTFQAATVLRILCEHRIPEESILVGRGKPLMCQATTGVFPGRPLPSQSATSVVGAAKWALWWLDLMTVQLFVRVFVLVGDSPCHDFHHRRYGSGCWQTAIYKRQSDKENGCPGYPSNYIDVWGLFSAIDHNIEALSRATSGSRVLKIFSH